MAPIFVGSVNVDRQGEITSLLIQFGDGDAGAMDRLIPLVYEELQLLARHHRYRWGEDAAAPGTASLVHDAYLKLVDQRSVRWRCRGQFYAIASRAMRSILIDNARWRLRAKRGGDPVPVPLEEAGLISEEATGKLLDLDRALTRLGQADERLARIVECRFFGGLSVAETAEALGVSESTVKRGWTTAQAWLFRELRDATGDATNGAVDP